MLESRKLSKEEQLNKKDKTNELLKKHKEIVNKLMIKLMNGRL